MGFNEGFTNSQPIGDQFEGIASSAGGPAQWSQDPIAIVGLACRLPGNSNTPTAFWNFLLNGGCASTVPPATRFNFKGHSDGSMKPGTMRSLGGMFLENIDPADIDAGFFRLSKMDAISMDPQQRQLLEVVYEGLENAGITLEALKGQAYGCFVGSYSSGKWQYKSAKLIARYYATRLLRYPSA